MFLDPGQTFPTSSSILQLAAKFLNLENSKDTFALSPVNGDYNV